MTDSATAMPVFSAMDARLKREKAMPQNRMSAAEPTPTAMPAITERTTPSSPDGWATNTVIVATAMMNADAVTTFLL